MDGRRIPYRDHIMAPTVVRNMGSTSSLLGAACSLATTYDLACDPSSPPVICSFSPPRASKHAPQKQTWKLIEGLFWRIVVLSRAPVNFHVNPEECIQS